MHLTTRCFFRFTAIALAACALLVAAPARAEGGGKALGFLLRASGLLFTGDPELDMRASTLVSPTHPLYGGSARFMWPLGEHADLGWGVAYDQGKTDGIVRPELVGRLRLASSNRVVPYVSGGLGASGGVLRSHQRRHVLTGEATLFGETGVALRMGADPRSARARLGVRGELIDPAKAKEGMATVQLGVTLPVRDRKKLAARIMDGD